MSVCVNMSLQVSLRPEEGVRSCGAGVSGGVSCLTWMLEPYARTVLTFSH